MSIAWLGLGSNVDAESHIRAGIGELEDEFGSVSLSPAYASTSVGFDGDDFINLVARVETDMQPLELRQYLRDLEDRYDRKRNVPKFSDRSLDIDILLYDDLVLISPVLEIPRAEILELVSGCTPAKLVQIVGQMNVLEMMMGLTKMRARRTPANQAHVTNRKENPALLAADAAEAALRGFAEVETTVGVTRYAPLNALAILVGSQTGRGGVLTQCAVEEADQVAPRPAESRVGAGRGPLWLGEG